MGRRQRQSRVEKKASMGQPGSGTLTAGPRVWRVLVVDDEENLNWSLVTSLRRERYAADGALTAEDARRRMADVDYDCVISDIQMPGIDGFQLLSWLREQRPHSRVIMMTAFGSPSVRQDALRQGVAAYLEKPFDLAALKRELRKALDTPAQAPTALDLIEITQVISLSRRDVAVHTQVGDQAGMLVFERGDLVSASLGVLRGDQAFFAMCAQPAQAATPAPSPEQVERNVTQPVSALIFDALLKRDSGAPGATNTSTASAARLPTSGPSFTSSGLRSLGEPSQARPLAPPSPMRAPITASLAPLPGYTSGPAPLQPIQPVPTMQPPTRDPQRTLASLVTAIARPCAVALIQPDGSLRAQAQTRVPPVPDTAFGLLLQGYGAFARAAQVGAWGAPRAVRLNAGADQAQIHPIGVRPGAPILVVVAPADIEPRQLEAIIAVHEAELIELTL